MGEPNQGALTGTCTLLPPKGKKIPYKLVSGLNATPARKYWLCFISTVNSIIIFIINQSSCVLNIRNMLLILADILYTRAD